MNNLGLGTGGPSIAVAEAASTPNPGYRSIAYSTTLSGFVGWNGSAWKKLAWDVEAAHLAGAETFSGAKTFSATPVITHATAPSIYFVEEDQGADLKRWLWVADGGQFQLQTRTDAGAFILQAFYVNRSGNGTFAGALSVGDNLSVTQRVGFGAAPATNLNVYSARNIDGAVSAYGIYIDGQVQSDVTTAAAYFQTAARTAAASFTCGVLRHFATSQGTFGAGSTVSVQVGFFAASNMAGAGVNRGFEGQIVADGTNDWNLWMAGTAPNHLTGALGIGTTAITNVNLRISRNVTGGVSAYNVYSDVTIQSDVTTQAAVYNSLPSTQATSFTCASVFHYLANAGTKGAGSTVTNEYGFYAAEMVLGTTRYGFYSNLAAAANTWAFYGNGTATSLLNGALIANHSLWFKQAAQTTKNGAATLTAAELLTFIIQYTGNAQNLTLPTAANMDSSIPTGVGNDMAFEFSVINTGSGTATMTTNTGWTLTGLMTVAASTSARFRARKTGSAAWTLYRMGS